jgi:hypothetical protein
MTQLALPAFLGSVRGTGCHLRRSKSNHNTGPFAANAAFCRLIFLQLPSSQLDMAEACGSRTQTFNSQLTANDDVTASAKFQLESIGVSRRNGLTDMQRLFLFGKLSGLNDKDAAITAGYSVSVAENTGQRIWKPRLRAKFERLQRGLQNREPQ